MKRSTEFTRRHALANAACGFGGLALAGLCQQANAGAPNPLASKLPHFAPKAKRVIFLFMSGGPSQMDTFDYKPKLQRDAGKDYSHGIPELQKKLGRRLGNLLGSPFKWSQHGESGHWVSELFPKVARHIDDLCVIKGMHTSGFDHGQAALRLQTGEGVLVRPSIGSWVTYGLGTENENLPGFITISPLRRASGTRGYANAFLPAIYQGTPVGQHGQAIVDSTVRHLVNPTLPTSVQAAQLRRLREMNAQFQASRGDDPQLEGVIQSFELAYRMQQEMPQVMDLSSETQHVLDAYGVNQQPTDDFARQCLLARRLAEAGVRFIQVTHAESKYSSWDQHGHLIEGLRWNCERTDGPIAALLADLKARGMWDDTIIWWGGEFGRTSVNEGRGKGAGAEVGRDHNPLGFTMWLAGGGVKGGFQYGETDEYGYRAMVDKVHMHDMHATLLHLLGLDHTRLTYRYAGRDFRLTDVYGRVVREILT